VNTAGFPAAVLSDEALAKAGADPSGRAENQLYVEMDRRVISPIINLKFDII
jgi:hypothetical protein